MAELMIVAMRAETTTMVSNLKTENNNDDEAKSKTSVSCKWHHQRVEQQTNVDAKLKTAAAPVVTLSIATNKSSSYFPHRPP